MGPGVNNKDLISVNVWCKTLNTAYISVTRRCIVFIFETRYIYSISLDIKCLSDVSRPLGGARGQ